MALTQRGINIPVTGQFQDGDDIVDALIAQGKSVDSAIGSAIGATVIEAGIYTDSKFTEAKNYADAQFSAAQAWTNNRYTAATAYANTRANQAQANAVTQAKAYTDDTVEQLTGLDPTVVADMVDLLGNFEQSMDATDTGMSTVLGDADSNTRVLAESLFPLRDEVPKAPRGAAHSTDSIDTALPGVTLEDVQELDESATLDDTADWFILQSFIKTCATNLTRDIRIPEGSYYLSRPLDLSGLEYGANIEASGVKLYATSALTTAMVKLIHGGNYWKGRRCVIRGLELRGEYNATYGVHIEGVQEWVLNSVRIHRCRVGISLSDVWYGAIMPGTVIQDCLTGLEFTRGNTSEINTLTVANIKINFADNKGNFPGEDSNTETIGIVVSTTMHGVDISQPVIEGVDTGVKYVPVGAGSGQQGGQLLFSSPYFEAIKVRYFDFSGMATGGYILRRNDLTIIGGRFLSNSPNLEPSIFSSGRHRIIGCEPFDIEIVQSSPASRLFFVTDGSVNFVGGTDLGQLVIHRTDATPTDANWQRYAPWGTTNAFPADDRYVGTVQGANYIATRPTQGLRGTPNSTAKHYQAWSVMTNPMTFYPMYGQKAGPVLRSPDGSFFMVHVADDGSLYSKKVFNTRRLEEGANAKTAKEMHLIRNDLELGTEIECIDLISASFVLTDVGGGTRRWCDGEGNIRIGTTSEIITSAASLTSGRLFDISTSQGVWVFSGQLRYYDWYGNPHTYRSIGTAAQRPADPEVGMVYYATDTDTYTKYAGSSTWEAFVPYN